MKPALHSTVDRLVFAVLGDWEVRRHAASALQAYFAPRGFLHLQLWHPALEISILTPSRLTGGRYEIGRRGIRIAVRAYRELEAHLLPEVALPGETELAALCGWTVERDAIAARGPMLLDRVGG